MNTKSSDSQNKFPSSPLHLRLQPCQMSYFSVFLQISLCCAISYTANTNLDCFQAVSHLFGGLFLRWFLFSEWCLPACQPKCLKNENRQQLFVVTGLTDFVDECPVQWLCWQVCHTPVLNYQFVKLVVLAEINLHQKQCQCSHHSSDSPAVTTVSSVRIPRPFSCLVSRLGGLLLDEYCVVAALTRCDSMAVQGVWTAVNLITTTAFWFSSIIF